jgi:hypothetical protein
MPRHPEEDAAFLRQLHDACLAIGSARHTPSDGWAEWFAKLDALETPPKDWNPSLGPLPTPGVLSQTRAFLAQLRLAGKMPSRLSLSVIGGIGITFRRGERKVYVEFSNKGSVHALFSDNSTDPEVKRIPQDVTGYSNLIEEVEQYLHE